MSVAEKHLDHPGNKGVNPAVAVLGAIGLAALLVLSSYLVFNRSKAASAAREISKQHQQIRKEQLRTTSDQPADETTITPESLDKQTEQIDKTLRSDDTGTSQSQPDDLSDKGLGLQ